MTLKQKFDSIILEVDMTRENFITIVSEINHKFKLYSNEKSVDKLHFDIMHMTLIETINGFPKEAWAKMP